MRQKARKDQTNKPESPATKEELLAKIDMVKIETQKKIDRIWRESLFDISGYEAELECFDQRGYLGYCHSYWQARKRILKEKYNIDWQTPAEENPLIIYD